MVMLSLIATGTPASGSSGSFAAILASIRRASANARSGQVEINARMSLSLRSISSYAPVMTSVTVRSRFLYSATSLSAVMSLSFINYSFRPLLTLRAVALALRVGLALRSSLRDNFRHFEEFYGFRGIGASGSCHDPIVPNGVFDAGHHLRGGLDAADI